LVPKKWGDINTIEKLKALIPFKLRNLSNYEDRLEAWGLTKLNERKLRGNSDV
jgi:hypothetical protein